MVSQSEHQALAGFRGATGNVPLVDLLQVWSLNRFSGLVAVTFEGRVGHLYYVDGEIVHAEAGAVAGEAAVGEILAWPGGAFEPIPNTTTLKRTITKKLTHLLLDAHRVIDERSRAGEPALTPPPLPQAGDRSGPGVIDRIRALEGVTRAVRFGRDGRTAPGEGPAGEALAAKGLYLALNHAGAVGATFGLRDVVVASVQGARGSFLIVHGNGNYLAVEVAPGASTDAVAAQVRALLTRPVAR